jgi:trehalose 6-phosphate phosphatase
VEPVRLLLVSDFDGTLSEIVPNPDQARALPGVDRTLAALASHLLAVCILSSRDSTQLRGLLPVPGIELLGDYGMGSLSGREAAALQRFNEEAARLLTAWPGVSLEAKTGSTAVHYRRAPDAAGDLARALPPLAVRLGLACGFGRSVLEVRPKAADKGVALARLIGRLAPEGVVFVGDDENDRPAFKLLAHRERSYSVGVRSDESPPGLFEGCDLVVDGPREAAEFLSRLAGWAGSRRPPPGPAAGRRSNA